MNPVDTGDGLLNYLLGGAGLGGIVWAMYERIARIKVEQAQNGSSVAESNANETLFNMLKDRLTTLEEEVKQLRKELNREREYTQKLITMMIAANLTPPPYPDVDP